MANLAGIFSQQSWEHHRISDTNSGGLNLFSRLGLPWYGQDLRYCQALGYWIIWYSTNFEPCLLGMGIDGIEVY